MNGFRFASCSTIQDKHLPVPLERKESHRRPLRLTALNAGEEDESRGRVPLAACRPNTQLAAEPPHP